MDKRKKYGIVFSIIVFIVVSIIALISSTEVNEVYEKRGENTYVIETVKQIHLVNYDTDVSLYVPIIKQIFNIDNRITKENGIISASSPTPGLFIIGITIIIIKNTM